MKKVIIPLFLLLPTLVVTGCANKSTSSTSSEVETTEITLNQTALSLFEDDSFLLEITSQYTGVVSYSSSNPAVASVSSAGRIIAKKVGKATIKVLVGKATATCEVIVDSIENKKEDYILCSQKEYIVGLNETSLPSIQPTYYVNGVVDTSKTFNYVSKNEDIASVSTNGSITLHKPGVASVEVSSNNVSTTIYLNVYTVNIKSTSDWKDMLETVDDKNARFYLSTDLDFSGEDYELRNGYDEEWHCHYIMGEFDGGFHKVSHITMTNTSENQSIFGYATAFTAKNVEFDSITFTSTSANGGLFTSLMHHITEDGTNNIYTTLVQDVICDFKYSSIGGSGIANAFYGGGVQNVFISMKDVNNNPLLPSKTWALTKETYLWWDPNFVSNMICYVPQGDVSITPKTASSGLPMSYDAIYKTSSLIEADFLASEYFDANIWDIKPNEIPTFK